MAGKSLDKVTVSDMIKDREIFYSVSADDRVRDASETLRRLKIRATGVLENEKLVGIISHYDLSTKIVAEARDPLKVKVRDIMTLDVVKVTLLKTFSECLELFEQNNISHLVIEDKEGKYYGVLSWSNMQRAMLENLQYQLQITQQYAFGTYPSNQE